MAKYSVLLSLSILLFFNGCIAQIEQSQSGFWQNLQTEQQHRLRAKTQCQIQQLNAREPNRRFQSEAGYSEFWNTGDEFQCAGVEFVRHTIQPKGLLLPYYTNTPQLVYVVKGSGIQGTVFPGCAETYEQESGSSYEQGESRRGEQEGRESRSDRHQKLRRFRQGDVIALPQGITHWFYNDGNSELVTVSLLDSANDLNQLDIKHRRFHLAGRHTESQQGEQYITRRGEREQEQEQGQHNNIFSGFDQELLAEAFQSDVELVSKLQSRDDNRGTIVRAERLHLVLPEYSRQEQELEREQQYQGGRYINGLEETFCSLKIRENIDHPTKADVFNPHGGRISSLNSQKLPILSYLRLSAERGVLYKNALYAPSWNVNAHSIMYVTRGNARVQVVNHQGRAVFDGEVNEGQVLIIPQNFVFLKKASNQGFEYIAFKTNDNAIKSQLAGRLSAIRAMPLDVLVNSYEISREQARNLKFNREESTVLSASGSSSKYERQE